MAPGSLPLCEARSLDGESLRFGPAVHKSGVGADGQDAAQAAWLGCWPRYLSWFDETPRFSGTSGPNEQQ